MIELKKEKKKTVTLQIEVELLKAIKLHAKKNQFKFREIVEHALSLYLESVKTKEKSDL